jgi:hypothetical protein
MHRYPLEVPDKQWIVDVVLWDPAFKDINISRGSGRGSGGLTYNLANCKRSRGISVIAIQEHCDVHVNGVSIL